MKERKGLELERNFVGMDTSVFVKYYNLNVPEAFPQASVQALERFREAYPALFKDGTEWTIDKHRKKLMDWLATYGREL